MSKQPRWQKARLISVPDREKWGFMIGAEVWTLIGRPERGIGFTTRTRHISSAVEFVRTNNIDRGKALFEPIENLELLARGPEDFAETVEMVEMEDFIAQARARSQK